MDGKTLAFATNLSWSDDVAHAAVGGIGSFSYDALEPLQYLARGSFSLMRYGSAARNSIAAASAPARTSAGSPGNDGNSMLSTNSFNPSALLLSRTFDIDIYERKDTSGVGASDLKKTFTIRDCRLTSYSITFTPGQLVSENIGFICIQAVDETVQNSNDVEI
jgi:hypothetical protein